MDCDGSKIQVLYGLDMVGIICLHLPVNDTILAAGVAGQKVS